jgi:DNA repair exonuclease SbcCD ATPase subunit
MKYYISKITAENLFSWKALDISFDNKTAYSFKGSNGVGKSSTFEIITWVLFKKTVKKNVKGNFGRDDGFGELTLTDGRSIIKVKRETTNSTFIHLKINNNKTEQVTQEQLDKLIGGSYPIFMSAVMCNQKRVSAFVSEDSDNGKAKIFGEMLGCSILDDMRKEVLRSRNELEGEYENLKGQVTVAKEAAEIAKMEFTDIGLDKYAKNLKDMEKELPIKLSELEVVSAKYNEGIKLNNEWNSYKSAQKRVADNTDELDVIKSKITVISKDFKKVNDTEKLRAELIAEDDIRNKIGNKSSAINSELSMLRANLRKLKERLSIGGNCPTCGSEITEKHKKYVISEIESLNGEISDRLKTYQALEKDYSKQNIIIDDLREAIKAAGLVQDRLNRLNATVKVLEQNIEKDSEIKEPKKKMDMTENQRLFGELNSYITGLQHRISNSRNTIQSYNNAMERLEKYSTDMEKKEKAFSLYKWMFDNIPNMKLKFIHENKVALEDLINENLANMDIPFNVKIETERQLKSTSEFKEAFSFDIISTIAGHKADKKDLSGGEEICVLLATQFAINDVAGMNFNFEIYDEIYSELDDRNTEVVINMLKERAKNKQIFTVSHEPEVSNSFDKIIHIKKKGKYSYVA